MLQKQVRDLEEERKRHHEDMERNNRMMDQLLNRGIVQQQHQQQQYQRLTPQKQQSGGYPYQSPEQQYQQYLHHTPPSRLGSSAPSPSNYCGGSSMGTPDQKRKRRGAETVGNYIDRLIELRDNPNVTVPELQSKGMQTSMFPI